jgi:hypothetical protein
MQAAAPPQQGGVSQQKNFAFMKPLFIILKGEYFHQIAAGSKTEEYRITSDYWAKKIIDRHYSHIVFQLGYSATAARMTVEYLGYEKKFISSVIYNGQVQVFALKLGQITEISNYEGYGQASRKRSKCTRKKAAA